MVLLWVWVGAATPAADRFVSEDLSRLQPLWHTVVLDQGPDSAAAPPAEIPVHHFDLPCGTCHDPRGHDEGWRRTRGVNGGCTVAACHDYVPMLNHLVGVAAPAGVAGNMFLDSGGRITCLTCHVPARGPSQWAGQGRSDGVLLRPEADLCASCHLHINTGDGGRAHWLLAKAHLGDIRAVGGGFGRVDMPRGNIDEESMVCLNCHDDITITIPGVNETRHEKAARWARMRDHPIGMDYRTIAAGGMAFFNYPGPAGNHVRLFDGHVGCGSCHSLYARDSAGLTVAERGRLCRTCHIR